MKKLILISLLLSISGFNAFADQEIEDDSAQSGKKFSFGQATTGQDAAEAAVAPIPVTVMEGPVDGSYVLGPNDILTIAAWGELSASWNTVITAEGRLMLPTVGIIDVRDATLGEATERIKAAAAEKYRNVELSVSLASARTFKVHVTGAVKEPGTYEATAVTRVSQLLIFADGLAPKSSRRNILLKRDGIEIPVDLDLFNLTGTITANPQVLDGDVIFVPTKRDSVSIWGEVGRQGFYEFKDGDDLPDIIALAGGCRSNAQLHDAEIIRFDADHRVTSSMTVDVGSVISGEESFPISRDDRIFIRSIADYRPLSVVTVRGEVKYPGKYPIEKNKTRISDIIRMAGGLTENANLHNASMDRNGKVDADVSRHKIIGGLHTALDGVHSVDFYSLFKKNRTEYDLLLQDNDYITVPRKSNTVTVSGRVANPGQIMHVPGKGVRYYVKLAGGYGKGAEKREVRVVKPGKGALKKSDVAALEPGDAILVPDKEDWNWWDRTKDVLSITYQVITIYIIVTNISSN